MSEIFKPGDRVRVKKKAWPYAGKLMEVVFSGRAGWSDEYVHIIRKFQNGKQSHLLYRADELEKVEDAKP